MRHTHRTAEVRELIQSGFRYALSLSHNEHDAEDLVQQACLQVFRSRKGLVNRQYLFAAIRNLFIDDARKQKRVGLQPLVDADAPAVPSHEQQIDHHADLEFLLGTLHPEEREVLYLNCLEGFSAREIGLLMEKPRGTVLSLLSRAKAKLTAKGPNLMETHTK